MSIDELICYFHELSGVWVQQPVSGDPVPEVAWGDVFAFYAPQGDPGAVQPFATAITKNYPDDERSRLERPGAFRVNVAIGREAFTQVIGRSPRDEPGPTEPDPSTDDVLIAHPLYGALGWVAVVNPGPGTEAQLRDLIEHAYTLARRRYWRRSSAAS